MIDQERIAGYWRRSRLLAVVMVVLTLALVVIPAVLHGLLDNIPLFGFQLGIYLVLQGALIVLAILAFSFAARQDRIDRSFGVAEDL